jgi:hypothetical protein
MPRKTSKAPGKTRRAEAADLQMALRATGAGKIPRPAAVPHHAEANDRHVDENLDSGLAETFPASDPVSISHGAD